MLLSVANLNIAINQVLTEEQEDLLVGSNGIYSQYLAADQTDIVDIEVRQDICEFGEQLPLFDRMIVHGVAVAFKNDCVNCANGYLFTAHSGVGKSTHAFLWQKLLGNEFVKVVNGDKPVVERVKGVQEDTEFQVGFRVWGSPWCGKERLHENVGVPLKGVLLLHRLYESKDNPEIKKEPYVRKASKEEFFDFMMDQTFLPHNPIALKKTFSMLEELFEVVPVWHLYADMSRKCIQLSVKTLTSQETRN